MQLHRVPVLVLVVDIVECASSFLVLVGAASDYNVRVCIHNSLACSHSVEVLRAVSCMALLHVYHLIRVQLTYLHNGLLDGRLSLLGLVLRLVLGLGNINLPLKHILLHRAVVFLRVLGVLRSMRCMRSSLTTSLRRVRPSLHQHLVALGLAALLTLLDLKRLRIVAHEGLVRELVQV